MVMYICIASRFCLGISLFGSLTTTPMPSHHLDQYTDLRIINYMENSRMSMSKLISLKPGLTVLLTKTLNVYFPYNCQYLSFTKLCDFSEVFRVCMDESKADTSLIKPPEPG